MKTEEKNMHNIIFRYIEGKANKSDLESVSKWNAENPSEFIDLEAIMELDDLSDLLIDYQQFPEEKAWLKIESKKSTVRTRRYRILSLSSAAMLLLLLMSTLLFLGKGEEGDVIVKGIDKSYLILDDNTEVYLSENATLRWKSDFLHERTLHLEGDAFFHVAKMEGTAFTIAMEDYRFTVLGTSFQIEQLDNAILIQMREGKLNIQSEFDQTLNRLIEGKESVLISASGIEEVERVFAYHLDKFSFKNESVLAIIKTMNDRFSDLISFDASGIESNCELTANFEALTLLEIMDELRLFFNLEYKIQNGRLEITRITC